MSKFNEVNSLSVNDKTEKKGGLTYLSWAWAWGEFKKVYPEAKYEVVKFDNKPYLEDENLGYMVFTKVEVEDLVYEMWLPVMDYRNKAIPVGQASMFDINKTIMRCLTKNLAMFGLGLYIYAGEDLPEEKAQEKRENQKKIDKRNTKLNKLMSYVRIAKLESEEVSQIIKTTFKKDNSGDLTDKELDELIELVKNLGRQ